MSDHLLTDRISDNLRRLKLPRIREIFSEQQQQAESNSQSYLSFLDLLLEEEVAQKEQRRIETALKISGLPFIKTIDDFDFTFQPKLDQRLIRSLLDLTFLQEKQNIILLGPPGVGKTHLAVSIAVKAIESGYSIYFTTMSDLIVKLKKDHEAGKSGKGRSYYKSGMVIVDEVGYTPISREECNHFFRFIANRYETASTIITSNKAFQDWDELFHDPIIVTAILDRLLHHSIVVNIKGNSYRLKDKFISQEGVNDGQ